MNGLLSQQRIEQLVDLYNQGNLEEALVQGQALAEQFPDSAFLRNVVGAVNARLGRFEQAVSWFAEAVRAKPEYAEAHNNLGNALVRLRRSEEAIVSFERAVEIQPGFAEAHNALGLALRNVGRFEEAARSYRRALEINPRFAEAHHNLGEILRDLRKPEEAIASFDRAIEINPQFAEAHNYRAIALNNLGRFEEAVESYHRAIEIDPNYIAAHRNLSTAKKYRPGDSHLLQMIDLTGNENLSDEERIHLNFALGKAHGDIGEYDKAFSYLADGNLLRKKQLNFDISPVRESFAEIVSLFSKELPEPLAHENFGIAGSKDIVFVIGMPRSGTTLIEQILASHSQVYGAGELDFLVRSVSSNDCFSAPLSPGLFQAIRDDYLSSLSTIDVPQPVICDKQPFNFLWAGFIVAALPEAKIVHVRRDARATCWSNFKHYFATNAFGFAYDLNEISEYYRMYSDLMAFWEEKFPGKIYNLDYEALTEKPEFEIRRLLENIGLDWEDQCLRFHETDRAVRTASDAQVRREIYRGSSDEWRKYAKHLDPMIETLSGLESDRGV